VACVLAGAAAARVAVRADRRLALGAGLGALLVLAGLRHASSPLRSWRDFSGGKVIVELLAAYGGARDVFLFPSTLDDSTAGRIAAPLWALEDKQAAVLASPGLDTAAVTAAIDLWLREGRRVMFVTDDPARVPDLAAIDARFVGEESLVTRALAPVPELPARSAAVEMRFVVYELVADGG